MRAAGACFPAYQNCCSDSYLLACNIDPGLRLKVQWDEPEECGGADIQSYILAMSPPPGTRDPKTLTIIDDEVCNPLSQYNLISNSQLQPVKEQLAVDHTVVQKMNFGNKAPGGYHMLLLRSPGCVLQQYYEVLNAPMLSFRATKLLSDTEYYFTVQVNSYNLALRYSAKQCPYLTAPSTNTQFAIKSETLG